MDSSDSMIIRRAAAGDAHVLAELGAATFVESFGHLYAREDLEAFLSRSHSAAAYERLIRDPDIGIWLAVSGDAPVGYVVAGACKLPVADLEAGAGEIRQLYVLAAAQGRRLGTRLLVTALEWLASRNRVPVYVGVWSQNLGAQRLYARFGFERIGEYEFPVGRQLDLEFILKQRGRANTIRVS
jgi:ribosomal protein S18 acetylase RimI-like enzyme